MKHISRLILVITVATITVACSVQKPLTIVKPENNATYKVEYLFEHDGCKVYRFFDYGNYVYFTNCTGNATTFSNDSINRRITTITNHE